MAVKVSNLAQAINQSVPKHSFNQNGANLLSGLLQRRLGQQKRAFTTG